MIKATCLAAPQRKTRTLRKLVLEIPQRTTPTQRYLIQSKHNQSIKCNKHVLDECIE
jgi:hypothetical protein